MMVMPAHLRWRGDDRNMCLSGSGSGLSESSGLRGHFGARMGPGGAVCTVLGCRGRMRVGGRGEPSGLRGSGEFDICLSESRAGSMEYPKWCGHLGAWMAPWGLFWALLGVTGLQ
jgi:hypothetical protein